MKRFIELPYKKKEEMGKAGRKKIEKQFDRKIIVENYMMIIKNKVGVSE